MTKLFDRVDVVDVIAESDKTLIEGAGIFQKDLLYHSG
jgi:hypothetical protein